MSYKLAWCVQWIVYSPSRDIIQIFPYNKQSKAKDLCDTLSKEKNEPYTVEAVKEFRRISIKK